MVCVLVPLPHLPETVENEAVGCRIAGAEDLSVCMGVLWQFQMKVSRRGKRGIMPPPKINRFFFNFFSVLTNAKR